MAQPITSSAVRSRNSRLLCCSTSPSGRRWLGGVMAWTGAPTKPELRSSRPTWAKGWLRRRSASSAGVRSSASGISRRRWLRVRATNRAPSGLAANSHGWLGKAAQVLAITTGFSTGAAKRKPKDVPRGAPPAINRRATGTLPHSQAGKAKPRAAPVMGPRSGWLGKRCNQPPPGASQRAKPAMRTPISRNGRASISRLWKIAHAVTSRLMPRLIVWLEGQG